MSNLQIIEELCQINAQQSDIIKRQAAVLGQLGAACLEEERATVERRLTALIGHDECPDGIEKEAWKWAE